MFIALFVLPLAAAAVKGAVKGAQMLRAGKDIQNNEWEELPARVMTHPEIEEFNTTQDPDRLRAIDRKATLRHLVIQQVKQQNVMKEAS